MNKIYGLKPSTLLHQNGIDYGTGETSRKSMKKKSLWPYYGSNQGRYEHEKAIHIS